MLSLNAEYVYTTIDYITVFGFCKAKINQLWQIDAQLFIISAKIVKIS